MEIGIKLKNRRKELNLTMLEIAKKVGVSEATVSRWESGDIANMRRDKIAALANALQVPPSFIMGWSDEPRKENKPEKPELVENMIVYHRDGKTSEVKLSPKKMDLLIQMIEEFKENDNPDL